MPRLPRWWPLGSWPLSRTSPVLEEAWCGVTGVVQLTLLLLPTEFRAGLCVRRAGRDSSVSGQKPRGW